MSMSIKMIPLMKLIKNMHILAKHTNLVLLKLNMIKAELAIREFNIGQVNILHICGLFVQLI